METLSIDIPSHLAAASNAIDTAKHMDHSEPSQVRNTYLEAISECLIAITALQFAASRPFQAPALTAEATAAMTLGRNAR